MLYAFCEFWVRAVGSTLFNLPHDDRKKTACKVQGGIEAHTPFMVGRLPLLALIVIIELLL